MTEVSAVEAVLPSSKPRDGSVLINIILDETGSMNSCWDATIASFNDYIGSQKTEQSGKCSVSLINFSNITEGKIRPIFLNQEVQSVPQLTRENYRPRGDTNLYDAIGYGIRSVEDQLMPLHTIPEVLFVIITDGGENSSTEFKLTDIRNLIKAKEQDGWTFVYLGANQNAWQVGGSLGLSKGQTMTYSTANMSGTMDTLAIATASYRSLRSSGEVACGTVGQNFFNAEQQDISKKVDNSTMVSPNWQYMMPPVFDTIGIGEQLKNIEIKYEPINTIKGQEGVTKNA